MPLTILMYGDCTSYNGRLERMLDYRGVGLAQFHCIVLQQRDITRYMIICTCNKTYCQIQK